MTDDNHEPTTGPNSEPDANPYEAPQQEAQPASKFGGYPAGETTSDERMWGLIAHLAWLAGSVVGFPVLGPLVVWLIKKEESNFIATEAKEALNFQINMLIGILIGGLLTLICIGFFVLAALGIVSIVFSILAALETNKGNHYRYPYIYRFIK